MYWTVSIQSRKQTNGLVFILIYCISFATYSLCSHTLAVANLDGNTETFLSWYKVNKQGAGNISALSQIDLPSGRSTKQTKSTQI